MTSKEAANWIINISADIGKAEHKDLWHYEQALDEIKGMLDCACCEYRVGDECCYSVVNETEPSKKQNHTKSLLSDHGDGAKEQKCELEDNDELCEAIQHLEAMAEDPIFCYEDDMKQVASWLKELKRLRAEKDFSDPPDLESYKKGYVDGFNEGVKTKEPCKEILISSDSVIIRSNG